MLKSPTLQTLFDTVSETLGLTWLSGAEFADQLELDPHRQAPESVMIGRMNTIHPYPFQVLGNSEIDFLNAMSIVESEQLLKKLFIHKPMVIIVTDDAQPTEQLKFFSQDSSTPLIASNHSTDQLLSELRYFFANDLAEQITLHGVFLDVFGIGLLLTGESAVGKSELALELIVRGHRLIADDAPIFSRIAPDILRGTCPEILQDYMEVRGLGILDIRAIYGDPSIKQSKYLHLIIRLEVMGSNKMTSLNRIHGARKIKHYLDVPVTEITLPVSLGRNLAVLIEAAVRDHILRRKGYDSSVQFSERQRMLMESE